jgi:hypothetical protein
VGGLEWRDSTVMGSHRNKGEGQCHREVVVTCQRREVELWYGVLVENLPGVVQGDEVKQDTQQGQFYPVVSMCTGPWDPKSTR